MILMLIAAGCFISGIALWKYATSEEFIVDAAPVGAIIMVISTFMMICGIFIFGFVFGKMSVIGI